MIYFKNLQTNQIIKFVNKNSIGAIFHDTTLYTTPTQSEIDTHLFNKKKQELIIFVELQRDIRKINYVVNINNSGVQMDYGLDKVIEVLEKIKSEGVYPTFIYYNRQYSVKADFTNEAELQFILNKFILGRRDNYHNNIPANMDLINACTTLDELENLQFTFVDLVINL